MRDIAAKLSKQAPQKQMERNARINAAGALPDMDALSGLIFLLSRPKKYPEVDPYNGDRTKPLTLAGAREAVRRLREIKQKENPDEKVI